jgi:hypothetical protein
MLTGFNFGLYRSDILEIQLELNRVSQREFFVKRRKMHNMKYVYLFKVTN